MGVPVELKMALGLKVGNRANAKATSMFGCRRARDIFGSSARGMSHGTVVEVLTGQFAPSLFLCVCAFVNTAIYQTKPVSLIITRETNVPIRFYFQPVWMTL